MKIFKYIGVLLVIVTFISSCNKELENPELSGKDLVVFYKDSGQKPVWEDFEILKGDSVLLELMVSPSEGTSVQWLDMADTSVISTNEFSYKFIGNDLGKYRRVFEAEKEGVVVKSTFNFSVLGDTIGSATSVPGDYVTKPFITGSINVSFSVDYDVTPKGNNIDGYVALSGSKPSSPNDHGGMSIIVRVTPDGTFDARNDDAYTKDIDISYTANETYHVRMDIDVVNQKYSVWITDNNGVEKKLASDYLFRAKFTKLKYWNLWSDQLGLHTVRNFTLSKVVVSNAPVFEDVDDVTINEGATETITVRAKDPLGGVAVISTEDLPRFVTFVDNANGSATLTYSPYDNCGGCDVGTHTFKLIATNSDGATEQIVNVKVNAVSNLIEVVADAGDGTVWANGKLNNDYVNLFGGHIDTGEGGDDHVVSVMPFELPAIPVGKKIKSAYFKVSMLINNSWVDVDYDVYAKTARETSEILPTDYYFGDYDGDTESVAIQQGFIQKGNPANPNPDNPPTNPPVDVTSSDDASVVLTSFINDQYGQGAVGKYIFMRIGSNRNDMPTWAHLQIKSADTDVEGTAPVLVLTLEDI